MLMGKWDNGGSGYLKKGVAVGLLSLGAK